MAAALPTSSCAFSRFGNKCYWWRWYWSVWGTNEFSVIITNSKAHCSCSVFICSCSCKFPTASRLLVTGNHDTDFGQTGYRSWISSLKTPAARKQRMVKRSRLVFVFVSPELLLFRRMVFSCLYLTEQEHLTSRWWSRLWRSQETIGAKFGTFRLVFQYICQSNGILLHFGEFTLWQFEVLREKAFNGLSQLEYDYW